MAKNNTSIVLGAAILLAGGLYFIKKTEPDTSNQNSGNSGNSGTFTPPATATTKSTPISVALDVTKALKDNSNNFVYNGKITWLNSLLGLKFQMYIDRYTNSQLYAFYKLWKSRTDVNLPYGMVDRGTIDRYIYDLLAAGKTLRDKLK